MKLDLDAENVREVEMTRGEARAYFHTGSLTAKFDLELDLAQGEVPEHNPQYVVIKIVA